MKPLKRDYINVAKVNKQITENNLKMVLDAESKYRGQLFLLAKKIISGNKNKIVLIAGPSCAGKTTSALLLKQILERYNKHVITISLDDFFVNRVDTPKLPDGSYDFDTLAALDLEQMEECFTELFDKGKAGFPRFDFKNGMNLPNSFTFELKRNTIILFEGLHVLNPEVTKRLGTEKFFKIYASTTSGFETKDYKVSTRNLRLIRRIIRDVLRRGHSPENTLDMWKNVCDAEDIYIAPYKNNVDYTINTTHAYELAIYKSELLELIMENNDVIRQLDFIGIFDSSVNLSKKMLPETSLMWEFIDKD